MRRGFQAAAERLAGEIRRELGLEPDDRLDPVALADEYGIPLASIADLGVAGASEAAIRQLTVVDRGCFSAGTVFVGSGRLIVYNPAHSDRRRANSIAHELSHVLLEHEPGSVLGPGGCRVWDKDVESEADTLAGMLLVTRDAALACARIGLPHVVGAARFGVSSELMRWRTDHSGAAKQARAVARRAGRTVPSVPPAAARALPSGSVMAWLADISAQDWRGVLRSCGRALSAGSVDDLCAELRTPLHAR